MDKVRIHAIEILLNVLHSPLPIHQKQTLLQLFPASLAPSNFATYGLDASASFSILAPCLDMDDYRYHAMLGFITSVGGMGKNVADISTKHLMDHVQKASPGQRIHFLNTVVSIFEVHAKNDRVILPALKAMSTLSEVLWGPTEGGSGTSEQLGKLIKLCGAQVRVCREVPKLSAFLEFAGNVQMCSAVDATISRSLMSILLGLLSHRYPQIPSLLLSIFLTAMRYPLVRKNAAACIFKYLLLQEETPAICDARSILPTYYSLTVEWQGSFD